LGGEEELGGQEGVKTLHTGGRHLLKVESWGEKIREKGGQTREVYSSDIRQRKERGPGTYYDFLALWREEEQDGWGGGSRKGPGRGTDV